MPGRVRVHRPSPEKEGEYKMRILSVLNEQGYWCKNAAG